MKLSKKQIAILILTGLVGLSFCIGALFAHPHKYRHQNQVRQYQRQILRHCLIKRAKMHSERVKTHKNTQFACHGHCFGKSQNRLALAQNKAIMACVSKRHNRSRYHNRNS